MWHKLTLKNLPPIKDKFYLFAGKFDKNDYDFYLYHYSSDGLINELSVEILLLLGIEYWCDPVNPFILSKE